MIPRAKAVLSFKYSSDAHVGRVEEEGPNWTPSNSGEYNGRIGKNSKEWQQVNHRKRLRLSDWPHQHGHWRSKLHKTWYNYDRLSQSTLNCFWHYVSPSPSRNVVLQNQIHAVFTFYHPSANLVAVVSRAADAPSPCLNVGSTFAMVAWLGMMRRSGSLARDWTDLFKIHAAHSKFQMGIPLEKLW